MTVASDFHYQSTLDDVCVCAVPWSEFPIVPAYPPYPQVERLRENLADFKKQHFHESKYLYQDVTCKQSI